MQWGASGSGIKALMSSRTAGLLKTTSTVVRGLEDQTLGWVSLQACKSLNVYTRIKKM